MLQHVSALNTGHLQGALFFLACADFPQLTQYETYIRLKLLLRRLNVAIFETVCG